MRRRFWAGSENIHAIQRPLDPIAAARPQSAGPRAPWPLYAFLHILHSFSNRFSAIFSRNIKSPDIVFFRLD